MALSRRAQRQVRMCVHARDKHHCNRVQTPTTDFHLVLKQFTSGSLPHVGLKRLFVLTFITDYDERIADLFVHVNVDANSRQSYNKRKSTKKDCRDKWSGVNLD